MNSFLKVAVVVVLAASVSSVGCSAEKKADTPPTEQVVASQAEGSAPKPSGTEEADADARDALLALQRVHFGFDKAELSEDSRQALTEAAAKLKDRAKVHLYVDGHADEMGTTEYNLQLGEKRAKAVSDFLQRSGIAADRLHIVSFGEEQPLAEGSDRAALAANRRVDFRLMRGDIELVLEDSPTAE